MLEQTVKNGAVYMTQIIDGKLHQKRPNIGEIKFGPRRPIGCHKESNGILVIDQNTKIGYLYQNETLIDHGTHLTATTAGYYYYYGLAEYQGVLQPYFIQNQPQATLHDVPNIEHFVAPSTLTGYPYVQTFAFDPQLNDLIGHCPATYVDRYKRPLNLEMMNNDRYYPTSIDTVTTTFQELSHMIKHYPIVVQLEGTGFGVLDLEPGYSEKELVQALSTPHIYKEDTPRGGIHFLVRVESKAFKYRWSKHLELITGTMVTFYGINGRIENLNAKPIDLSGYKEVGHNPLDVIVNIPDDVDDYVKRLTIRNKELGSSGLLLAEAIARDDEDQSHGDYMALRAIYQQDIEPFSDQLPEKSLGWILAIYGQQAIPWRMKHDEYRNKVPYLVYVAHAVIMHARQ